MNYRVIWILVLSIAPAVQSWGDSGLKDFVLIQGSEFTSNRGSNTGGSNVRIEDFEILDHPITNQEYQVFIDATRWPAPLHWKNGSIPEGKENHPVIFINRTDVEKFLEWASRQDGRVYRLPTSIEFEYAARGGLDHKKYPWGNENPPGKANFDEGQNRPFDRWPDYLQPARWGEKNGFGLYGMAGNIWQMVIENPDPATAAYKYRIEDLSHIETVVMGGSWARSAEYLPCGYRLSTSSGIRHPDLGFRPVRQPINQDWGIETRQLSAVSLGNGQVFLSWACLPGDTQSTRFNLYRATSRNHAGFRIHPEALTDSCYADSGLKTGVRYQYYLRPVDSTGKEGKRSEWVGIDATPEAETILTSFHPLFHQGSLVPIFGDLNGDGTLDCVIRLDNGNQEMSQDPGLPVQLEAFTSYGRSLWRKDICYHDHCYGSANNVPFNVWDMDNDGKAEVITRLQIGDEVYAAILNGMTGEVLYKAPWPAMVSDFSKSSTRIHLSIAYLDGENPAVITQTGLYENEVFVAFDSQMKKLWEYDSFAETSGSGGHKIEVADVDGDGKQEVFDGTTCLNHDGTLRWSIYRQHPDIVSIHDYLPDRPGLEVFYIVESSVHAGVYMVDANSGEVIWKVNREDDPRWTHGHYGWTSDIWDGSPGIECISNRAGHGDTNVVLFSADGQVLLEPFPYGFDPMEWDGDPTRELWDPQHRQIGDFDGHEVVLKSETQPVLPPKSSVLMTADLYGDFRDELVLTATDAENKRFICVLPAVTALQNRFITPSASLDYRLWIGRNMGGGYESIFDHTLISLPNE